MKIAIYSPYLDTFGGGERYMMTIAESLSDGNSVEVFLDEHLAGFKAEYLKAELSKRFNLNLEKVKFTIAPIGMNSNGILRTFFLKNYDLLFYLTDGSIFYGAAKKNILHMQSPLVGQPSKSIWGKLKLKSWDMIIYNSHFTKNNSEFNWPLPSQVIYPPIETSKIKPLTKKKYILSVGRFFGYLKNKKHELMIEAFRDLRKGNELNDWSLHLAGAASEGDKMYLQELKRLSKGTPIYFYPNIDYDKLVRLYGESSIYWHAAGFKETDPTKMEHFGISTVESMAGGCVPVVVNQGGQMEIVEHGKDGFLWSSIKDLERFTITLVKDSNLRHRLSQNATLDCKRFSKIRFENEITKLI